ncbi:MAG: hypothetical protein RLZZ116_1420 [Planctomycetota bacterium]
MTDDIVKNEWGASLYLASLELEVAAQLALMRHRQEGTRASSIFGERRNTMRAGAM